MALVWKLLLLWVNFAQVAPLKCLQCVGTSSSCRMVARKCPAYETTCISLAYQTQDSSNTVMKGCSTTQLCNQSSIIDTGTTSIYMTASCCETDYCNINRFSASKVYSNRLQCNVCNNSITTSTTITCPNRQSLFCDEVNNNCVDVITMETNGSTQIQKYTKGCGSGNIGDVCTNLFAYSTGTYQRYTYLSCCTGNLCNSGQKAIPMLTNDNGIKCYGCKDNGNNECAKENQKPVTCRGTLLRCMEVFDDQRRTIMKGCCTVAFCSSTDLAQPTDPSPQQTKISEIMCCAGSFCNDFSRNKSSDVITPSSTAYRNTDYSILAVFICVISAFIGH
ncbi:urokinase plasminogen activator surface receptor-like [Rana temporaria]|uniref:urokinase plasminogen activator surface receptor-like n=1 Tax=Rana temporaria TaxID=8407 RepID=UPI001AAD7133|nr:urokinase plasminogen activator surface receptor-like [Rana temporaria]